MSKILVVYYSFSNTTKALATEIAKITKGNIREIIPEKSYSFNYNAASKEVRNEIEKEYCPKLLFGNEPIHSYDFIFIGSPNWFKSFAPPVLSFLRTSNLDGKIVVPFCTHGGGGFGQISEKIINECPKSTILTGLETMGNFDKLTVKQWLRNIDVL